MKLWTAAQAAAVDRHTIDGLGVASAVLIERAALVVARIVAEHLEPAQGPVVALAGPGNNGADAVAVARILHGWGLECVAVLATEHRNAAAAQQVEWARACGVTVRPASQLASMQPVGGWVDGLLGTGSKGAPRGGVAEVLGHVADRPGTKIAIDVPSGIDVDSGAVFPGAFAADVTVTMGRSKPGLHVVPGLGHAGRVVVAAIGLQEPPGLEPAFALLSSAACRVALQALGSSAHKGQRGHVGVIAGGEATPGAAVLAASAAMRSLAGLCTVSSSSALVKEALTTGFPEVMFVEHDPVPGDALVIGPGLTDPSDGARLRALFESDPRPAVWDASGLDALVPGLEPAGPRVLTPHPGEAARLMARLQPSESWTSARVQTQRVDVARMLAAGLRSVVVLKGAGSLVAQPDGTIYIGVSGTNALATAGSGDVLAGLTGALLAAGLDAAVAAGAAVHLHGLAGRIASGGRAHGVVASDVVGALAAAIAQCLDGAAPICVPDIRRG